MKQECAPHHQAVFELDPDASFVCDPDGRMTRVNQAFLRLTGYGAGELIGREVFALAASTDEGAKWRTQFRAGLEAGSAQRRDISILHRKGHPVPLRVKEIPIVQEETVSGVYCVARHSAREKRLHERLDFLTTHDPLTGLLNRAEFYRRLREALARSQRKSSSGALLMIELDEFKEIVATLGHEAGDHFAVAVRRCMVETLGEGALIARLGSDEFAVLLEDVTTDDAMTCALGLSDEFSRRSMTFARREIFMSASIGVACFPEHGTSAVPLTQRATAALYAAQRLGRNRHVLFSSEHSPEDVSMSTLLWRSRLLHAFRTQAFYLESQPLVNLQTYEINHHELLLRMVEGGKKIPPGVFVDYAERFHMVQSLDAWAIEQAINFLADADRRGEKVHLSVNISGSSLIDEAISDFVKHKLNVTRVKPGRLILEITETDAIANIPKARAAMHSLRHLGCRFALDDFGKGFSSMSYLKHLPVDYIKIDGGFIRDLRHSKTDQQLVLWMTALTRELGKPTVAEQVEDEWTARYLRSLGVDYAQGYFFEKPQKLSPAVACERRWSGNFRTEASYGI